MSVSHTPGPWDVRIMTCIGGPAPVVVYDRGDYGGQIASLALCGDGNEQNANARLIAAAPELLEALENLVNSFEKHRPKEYWDAARAAIKKAALCSKRTKPMTDATSYGGEGIGYGDDAAFAAPKGA